MRSMFLEALEPLTVAPGRIRQPDPARKAAAKGELYYCGPRLLNESEGKAAAAESGFNRAHVQCSSSRRTDFDAGEGSVPRRDFAAALRYRHSRALRAPELEDHLAERALGAARPRAAEAGQRDRTARNQPVVGARLLVVARSRVRRSLPCTGSARPRGTARRRRAQSRRWSRMPRSSRRSGRGPQSPAAIRACGSRRCSDPRTRACRRSLSARTRRPRGSRAARRRAGRTSTARTDRR